MGSLGPDGEDPALDAVIFVLWITLLVVVFFGAKALAVYLGWTTWG